MNVHCFNFGSTERLILRLRRESNSMVHPKVRAKHFITCSYNDLVYLSHNLRNITTEKYTEELAKKTEGYGDCCMLSVLEWGHSRNDFSETLMNIMIKITWITKENSLFR